MKNKKTQYVVCIKNTDYEASLDLRKIYKIIADPQGSQKNLIRIVDESGEDYLYPEEYFLPINLPEPIEHAISQDVSL